MKVNNFLLEKFRDMGFEDQELKEKIFQLNLTSLEKVDLILTVQEEYGIILELSELKNFSIESLQEYISRRA